jgi:trans-aconitate 2-methyltransferase
MTWSAMQYTKFEAERNQPIFDLLARIAGLEVRNAADLGCGPGNSTELLKARFPTADVRGMDSSPEMIAAARERLPQVQFELADLDRWTATGPFDLLFANASLQWIPDHGKLLPSLLDKLAPRGTLAVQMPDNLDEPAHKLMREVAASGPWAEKLGGAANARAERRMAGWYFQLLRARCDTNIWRTTYFHPLAGGAAAVVEWFMGSGLRPFLAPLEAAEKAAFLARYTETIDLAYPALPDGTVLLPFPRLFMVATLR